MKLEKSDKTYFVDDGQDRGPMTVKRLRFHPSGAWVFAQVVDRRLAVWDVNGAVEKVKKGEYVVGSLVCPHDLGWVRGFDVHPKGQWLVTAGSDRRLKLWRFQDGKPADKPAFDVQGHDGWCEAAAFSPDGQRIATAGADHAVKVWDAGDLKPVKTISVHTDYARDVAWTRDGKWLLSGAEDGKVLVIDAATLEVARTIEFGDANDQQGQNPRVSGAHRLAVSHDDRWLAVAGGQKTNLYDLHTGDAVATESVQTQAAFHRTQPLFAGGENEVKVWQYQPDQLKPPAPDKKGNPGRLESIAGKAVGQIKRGEYSQGLAFSPDGKTLAAGKNDGTIEFWQLKA